MARAESMPEAASTPQAESLPQAESMPDRGFLLQRRAQLVLPTNASEHSSMQVGADAWEVLEDFGLLD